MNALKRFVFGGAGGANLWSDIGLAILRIAIGLMMAFGHGKGKLFTDAGFGPPERFVSGVAKLGFPAPNFFAWCAGLTEFIGALLLAVGLITRPVAIILCLNMAVAAFGTHWGDPIFKGSTPSYKEPALLYLAPFLMFACTGAGRFSADHFIQGKRP
jgi:putative oxidoreductase